MNQLSSIGLGSDISVIAGYLLAANDRLGKFDIVVENNGLTDATIILKEYTGRTGGVAVSGFEPIGSHFVVKAGGTLTRGYTLLSKKVGLFGSGNATVNVSTVIRNKGNLRGAQIDIVNAGRRGWGFDPGFNTKAFKPVWGSPPDAPALPEG